MKKITTLAILIAAMQLAMAQAPQLLNYQSVVRNAQGLPVQNTLVNFQFQILAGSQTGTPVFTETDTVTTNQFGLATVQIGNSTPLSDVSWSSGSQYLQVGVDVTGGGNFVTMGVSQLLSVPYALYSGSGWGLTGNTGTTYGTSFIGTTDNNNLMFRVNDSIAGRIEGNPTNNTSFGVQALDINTGTANSGFGIHALYHNTTGSNNTATGAGALRDNTTGSENTAGGTNALYNNTTGNNNVAAGYEALNNNQTLSYEVAIGDSALYSVTADTGANTAIGSKSLFANTTGSYNTASGFEALTSNVTGYNNTASGAFAMKANTAGSGNSAFGELALYANLNGDANSAFGRLALGSNTTGTGDAAFGFQSLTSNTLGEYNTATGSQALAHNTSGFSNTAVGYSALYSNTTGNNNTSMGYQSDVGFDTLNNATAIGYGAISNANNKVVIGNTNVTSIGGQVAWTNYSDERVKTNIEQNVPGLAFIKQLQPVTYHYDINKENEMLGAKNIAELNKGKHDVESITFSGFLAQKVEVAAKSIGYSFSGVDKNGSLWGLRYSEFVPSIVKSVQEIDSKVEEQKQAEQSIILKLQQQIEAMQKEIDALKNK